MKTLQYSMCFAATGSAGFLGITYAIEGKFGPAIIYCFVSAMLWSLGLAIQTRSLAERA